MNLKPTNKTEKKNCVTRQLKRILRKATNLAVTSLQLVHFNQEGNRRKYMDTS